MPQRTRARVSGDMETTLAIYRAASEVAATEPDKAMLLLTSADADLVHNGLGHVVENIKELAREYAALSTTDIPSVFQQPALLNLTSYDTAYDDAVREEVGREGNLQEAENRRFIIEEARSNAADNPYKGLTEDEDDPRRQNPSKKRKQSGASGSLGSGQSRGRSRS